MTLQRGIKTAASLGAGLIPPVVFADVRAERMYWIVLRVKGCVRESVVEVIGGMASTFMILRQQNGMYHIRVVLRPQLASSPDLFVPSTIFQNLPAHKPKSTAPRNPASNLHSKDYRFGPIRLDWVDFGKMSKASYSTAAKERVSRGGAHRPFPLDSTSPPH